MNSELPLHALLEDKMRDGVTTIVVFSFIIFGAIVGTSIGLSTWPDKQV